MSLFGPNDSKFIKAVNNGDSATVKKYLVAAKDIDKYLTMICDADNRMPLHVAALNSDTEMAKLLISYGAPMEARNKRSNTPLLIAVGNAKVATTAAILDGNPDLTVTGGENKHVLEIAMDEGKPRTFELLLSAGARNISPNTFGNMTDIHYFYYNALIVAGFKPETMLTTLGLSIFERFVQKGDSVRLLTDMIVRGGVDPNAYLSSGELPLNIALTKKDTKTANALLHLGADPERRDMSGKNGRDIAKEKGLTIAELENSPEPAPAEAPPVTNSANDNNPDSETWKRIGDDKVAFIGDYASIGKRITEIFNFTTHKHYAIVNDIAEKTQSQSTPEDFTGIDSTMLEKAFAAYQAQDGAIPRDRALPGNGGKFKFN